MKYTKGTYGVMLYVLFIVLGDDYRVWRLNILLGKNKSNIREVK